MKYLLSGILLFILFILGLAKAADKKAPKPWDPRGPDMKQTKRTCGGKRRPRKSQYRRKAK